MSCGNGVLTKETFAYDSIYRAEVVSTADPLQAGRIKVRVFGIFENDVAVASLPWAVPAQPLFAGAGSGYGHWAVPEVGTHVFVFFEGQDVYQPVYFAEAPSKVHGQPSERTTSYPFRKIMKTKNGIVIYIDDQSKVVRVNHPTGKYVEMDGSGNVKISGADVTIEASGDATVNVTGDVDVTAGGNITMTGTKIDLNP